jgi:aminoglycoside/choline kinase family phosphotransferase
MLLKEAVDHIVTIQENGTKALKPEYEGSRLAFDEEKLFWEFSFFFKHYFGNYQRTEISDKGNLLAEFRSISRELSAFPRLLCHRDFHVRNMMVKKGILYVIDFQDARWGPPCYDLASLLKDSLELDSDTVEELIDYYLTAIARRKYLDLPSHHFDREAFDRQFQLMCVQRLLKALGTYAYQIIVRENFIYEQYMAGSLHRALSSLRALPQEFPAIQSLIEEELQRRGAFS